MKKLYGDDFKLIDENTTKKAKMVRFICPQGHEFKKSISTLGKVKKENAFCRTCEYRKIVEEAGHELLEDYKGTTVKIKHKCPQGHVTERIPANFQRHSCKMCYVPKGSTFKDELKERLEEQLKELGWEMVGEYKGTHKEVLIKCSRGHEFTRIPSRIGNRCEECWKEYLTEEYEKLLKKEGWKLHGKYEGDRTPIVHECPRGHIQEKTPRHFKNGYRCSDCYYFEMRLESVDKYFKDLTESGWELLEEFQGMDTSIKHKCPQGHIQMKRPVTFKKGSRCYECSVEKYSGEGSANWKGGITEITEWLRDSTKQWRIDSFISNDRKCVVTGERAEVIHHIKPHHEIVKEVFETTGLPIYQTVGEYTSEQLNELKEKHLELHYKYGLGVPLTSEVHNEFHKEYGFYNTTWEQFEEFKNMRRII